MIIEALDALDGQRLTRIVGKGKEAVDSGGFHYDEIWLIGEKTGIHLSVNNDTDEIVIVTAALGSEDGEDIEVLTEYLSKPWGWYWYCENSQGYFDMLVISVDGIDPQIGFLGIGSALEIKKMISL